ncbi:L-Ala-D/L-Glu epimerase [Ditylenchus destructor]|uniref:L-Ala-D/L-Glu epimerase n=1 Tax=Ditylenchus destructor TaxID=166010 RepID=A0AAD4MHT5_9BILA|nr:L-Ala-D/L-Glu epimerase [Ditylenchus destructor]
MIRTVETVREAIEAGITRAELQQLLPPGGARNAVDCALWELEARQKETTVMALAGIADPRPLVTVCTVGFPTRPPGNGATGAGLWRGARAEAQADRRSVQPHRVRAVRAACPKAGIGVDANQGLNRATTEKLLPVLLEANVALLEHPGGGGAGRLARRPQVAHPARCGRKRAEPCRPAVADRALSGGEYQARQMRRTDRGAGDRPAGVGARPQGDGRQHARHLLVDGPGLCRRPALRRRRS